MKPEQIDRFFERVINGKIFNFERLVKLITSVKRQPIIESTTVKVNGFSNDNRRTRPLNESNPFLEASLLCTGTDLKPRGRSRSKLYTTDYISNEQLKQNLVTFIRNQLKIDDELEDIRIQLVASKDFYPKPAFDQIKKLSLLSFMHEHIQPVTSDDCDDLKIQNYTDFLLLLSPQNKDFTELMMNRQLDRDLIESQNHYIDQIDTIESAPRRICMSDPYQEDVMKLLAVTLSMIVLNRFKNGEILKTYRTESKNKVSVPIEKLLFEGKENITIKTVYQFIGLKGK